MQEGHVIAYMSR
jgi:hypothetical protein